MAKQPPSVYILHGEDDYAIAQFIASLKAKLGDPSTADMNFTRLDLRSSSLEQLIGAASAMPFLAARRVVVAANPLVKLTTQPARQKFLDFLEKLQPSSALVLVENKELTSSQERARGDLHWLEKWARQAGERAYAKVFRMPEGADMEMFILGKAKEAQGQFSRQGAEALARRVGADTRLASQEIEKLLLYVNFSRPVEAADVEKLSPFEGELEDFALANAIRDNNGAKALRVVRRLLEEEEPFVVLQTIVYQFRLLLVAREALELQGSVPEAANQLVTHLKIKAYPARLAAEQAKRFSLAQLELIYRRLLQADEAIKTSQMPGDLVIETLVAELLL